MRIAIATVWLWGRSGTEIVTIDFAKALKRRGHDVFVFAGRIGESASLLAEHGIVVVDDLANAPFEPQVVHGNHNVVLVQALLRFPRAVGVFVCHDAQLWQSRPPELSRIRKHVAVDLHCLARMERDLPAIAGKGHLVHNAVDLDSLLHKPKLQGKITKALILTKNRNHVETIRTVCESRRIDTQTLGPGVGKIVDDLPCRLKDYDVVFATARMAIEAMASGCAVVVCDARGFAGLVTPANVAAWRDRNFGVSILDREVTTESIDAALNEIDADNCWRVSEYIRKESSLEKAVQLYEQIYQAAASEPPMPSDEALEFSSVLRDWLPGLEGYAPLWAERIEAQSALLRQKNQDIHAEARRLQREVEQLRADRWVKAALVLRHWFGYLPDGGERSSAEKP